MTTTTNFTEEKLQIALAKHPNLQPLELNDMIGKGIIFVPDDFHSPDEVISFPKQPRLEGKSIPKSQYIVPMLYCERNGKPDFIALATFRKVSFDETLGRNVHTPSVKAFFDKCGLDEKSDDFHIINALCGKTFKCEKFEPRKYRNTQTGIVSDKMYAVFHIVE